MSSGKQQSDAGNAPPDGEAASECLQETSEVSTGRPVQVDELENESEREIEVKVKAEVDEVSGEKSVERQVEPSAGKQDEPKRKECSANEYLTIEHNNRDGRRVSAVSFKEVCELYEIDLEKGERQRQVIKSRPSALQSVRYYVMLLALISPFVTTYSRTIINFAITDMIDPRFTHKQAESHQQQIELAPNSSKLLAFDLDNSCPVEETIRQQLVEQDDKDTRRAQTTSGEKFEWDTFQQGLLKGAYAYGHAFFQIPGSRLSEIYGSHLVISINAMLIGACCLAAPFLASLHFYLIFVDLMILGVIGSFMTPAAITLFSNWLTPGEKSLMMSFMLVGSRLGYALSSFLCGYLLQQDISWRYVFYSSGFTGLSFGIAFFLLARSRPKDHPLVSQLELDYLATKNTLVRESLAERKLELDQVANGRANEADASNGPERRGKGRPTKRKAGAPWLALATNAPVWAFVLTKFCVKLAGDTAQIELPAYLKRVMHYSAADNGKVNGWNYVIFCVGCLSIGTIAKNATKTHPLGMSKTTIRKIFQSVASFGVSLTMLGIAFSVCDKFYTQLFLMLFFFVTTFGMGGEAQSPLDLSERYSGTIHAIGSSLAISGAIEPTLVGYFLQGRSADKDQWKLVWLGASAVAFIGGLIFLLFGDANVQPFDQIGRESTVAPILKGPEVANETEEGEQRGADDTQELKVATSDRESDSISGGESRAEETEKETTGAACK